MLKYLIENMKEGQHYYVGPYASQSSISSQISKYKPDGSEFRVTKLYAIDNKFTEIFRDIYKIERLK